MAPSNPEKPIKYVRKPIDYSLLDEIGHGISVGNRTSLKARTSMQMSGQSLANAGVGPPPTTKPPTPPQMGRAMTGTLKAGSTGTIKRSEYRTPPIVVPPQVPSHYAPGYQSQRSRQEQPPQQQQQPVPQQQRGPDYRALPITNPMPPSQVAMHHTSPPQVGMVHPMQNQIPTTTYEDRSSMPRKLNARGTVPSVIANTFTVTAPPSPLTVSHDLPVPDHGHIGLHTLSRHTSLQHRPGSQSPPLPPPPPEEQDHVNFGRPQQAQITAIIPDDQNLPGWVPKNYIEKGRSIIRINLKSPTNLLPFHSSCRYL